MIEESLGTSTDNPTQTATDDIIRDASVTDSGQVSQWRVGPIRLYWRSRVIWFSFTRDGVRVRQSSRTVDPTAAESIAKALYKKLTGEAAIAHVAPRLERSLDGTIYFIRCKYTGRIKIGSTENLSARLATLSAMSPTQLELLLSISAPKSFEFQLHTEFATSRLHGEWFVGSEELLNRIEQLRKNPPELMRQKFQRMLSALTSSTAVRA